MPEKSTSFFLNLLDKTSLGSIFKGTVERLSLNSRLVRSVFLAVLVIFFSICLGCSQKKDKLKTNLEIKSDSVLVSLASSSKLQEGYKIYKKYGCILCHGVNGEKGIPNKNAQTGEEIPALTYVAEGYTIEELKQQILKGLNDIPKKDSLGPTPPYRMPSWKEILTEKELEAITFYLFSLMPEEKKEEW